MRIWSKQAFAEINQTNRKFLEEFISEENTPSSTFQIGIVGGGPKGVYAIERLASIWNAHLPEEKLEIICFNKDVHFASGPNYLPEQPDFLLINYSLGNVNFWTEEAEQLVENRESLLEFIIRYQDGDNGTAAPEDFCSRALTGIYLQHSLCRVISSLPETIQVQLVPQAVDFIEKSGDKINLFAHTGKLHVFSGVIFCTGHSYTFQDAQSYEIKKVTSSSEGFTYIEHVYPITQLGSSEFLGKRVLIQGMGLTFVDAALGLTEGLGGKFNCEENVLTYNPSGREPETIYPYSRTGLPMLARAAGGFDTMILKYFTTRFVEKLLNTNRKLDFEAEIYPTIEREYRYQFVKSLLIRVGHFPEADESNLDLEEIESLAKSAIPDFTPFDLESFLLPSLGLADYHEAVMSYIRQSITTEKLAIGDQATLEMTAVWRAIYPNFRKLYNFGRLTGKSQEKVDKIYFGKFQRVSYGPPIWNMRKIYALASAGIIRFDIGPSPTLHVNPNTHKFEISSTEKWNKIASNILINARIAKGGSLSTHPLLYQNLYKTAGIDLFQNETYRPGCFNMNKDGALLNLEEITLNGTPTEGWTLDNESLSRTNNNFISPWANKLVKNYVSKTSQTNPYCPSMD